MAALAVGLSVLLGAVAQSVSGIGFVLVAGPALVAVLGPAEGVRLGVALSLLLNVGVLAREHSHARVADAALLLVPAALTTPLWAVLLRGLDPGTAARGAGAAVLVGAGALAFGLRWAVAAGRAGAIVAGIVSSAMNVLAAAGGPAVALYAANAGWPARRARATLQAFFLALNVVALATLGLPRPGAAPAAGLLGLAVGLGLGARVGPKVSETRARRATLALAAGGGLLLLLRGG